MNSACNVPERSQRLLSSSNSLLHGTNPWFPKNASNSVSPNTYGGTDANAITGEGGYPKVTQIESFIWSNGSTIVVDYNDSTDFHGLSSPSNALGVSYSTNGGVTFTRPRNPVPFASGHGDNIGDPMVVWNARLQTWFAGDLVRASQNGGCGTGIGIGLWTSADGINWSSTGPCVHNNDGRPPSGGDDRESMWVDNNPNSPNYGRMYVSWNNHSTSSLVVAYSDPTNGNLWFSPVTVHTDPPFIRNVQLTGSPSDDGAVFLVGLDAGDESDSRWPYTPRTNYMWRSMDGGQSWQALFLGAAATIFQAPGDHVCRLHNPPFEDIVWAAIVAEPNDNETGWRIEGWGQPGVGPNGVVHYVYNARNTITNDPSDIYYIRSTNNGDSWSSPMRLNTDGTTRPQWQPSLSVTSQGAVTVGWYDRRDTIAPDKAYRYYGRVSYDNGATWQPDMSVSDQIIPQSQQPDLNVSACNGGDYNYHSALGDTAFLTWADGRNSVQDPAGTPVPQYDIYFDKINFPTAVPTLTNTKANPHPNTYPYRYTHLPTQQLRAVSGRGS